MTKEEIIKFKDEILKTITPHTKYMNNKKIKEIIELVQKQNQDLPKGFADMLFEQILMNKHK